MMGHSRHRVVEPQRQPRLVLSLPLLLPLLIIALRLPEAAHALGELADPAAGMAGSVTGCQLPFYDEEKLAVHMGKSLILKDVCLEQVSRSDDTREMREWRRLRIGGCACECIRTSACAACRGRQDG